MWVQSLGQESPGIGNGNPLHYSAWKVSARRNLRAKPQVAKRWTQLSAKRIYMRIVSGPWRLTVLLVLHVSGENKGDGL